MRVLGVSGVWTPGLPIFSKFGILGVSGVWESRTMNCTKAERSRSGYDVLV